MPTLRDFSNKYGRFTVAHRFYDRLGPDEGVNLFHRMVVLDVKHSFMSHTAEYMAIHPDFRPVSEGEVIPEYVGQFTSDSPYPIWVEVEPNH